MELFYMIVSRHFLYWPVSFLFFFLTGSLVRRYYSRKYSPYKEGLSRKDVKVSVVIPEYKEEIDILERCIKSAVESNPDEVILVYEDNRPEVKALVKKYKIRGVDVTGKNLRKRGSLVVGWLMAKGDIIVQLDSDTVMSKQTLEEIVKPFADPKVVGVQGHPLLFRTGSKLAFALGQIIELSRDVVCRALNGNLVVIDGKIAAYRRSFLISIMKEFLYEKWGKMRIIGADDRALTFFANLKGYKTVYQSTAIVYSAAQPTLYKFLLQQMRWARSGYLYFLKDLKSGLFFMVTRRYRFQQITYLFGPLSLAIAITQTVLSNVQIVNQLGQFINQLAAINVPLLLYSVSVFLFGSLLTFRTSLFLLGVDLNEVRKISLAWFEYLIIPLLGLFLIFPLMLYSMITYNKINQWLTREMLDGVV
jgi:cellulose synthase/poly-beta-1,6-N-acetylglucosamine synthase-like glycosyltransferase